MPKILLQNNIENGDPEWLRRKIRSLERLIELGQTQNGIRMDPVMIERLRAIKMQYQNSLSLAEGLQGEK